MPAVPSFIAETKTRMSFIDDLQANDKFRPWKIPTIYHTVFQKKAFYPVDKRNGKAGICNV